MRSHMQTMPKEKYTCQLCANHGIYDVPKRGHKPNCPYKECECVNCSSLSVNASFQLSCHACALNSRRRVLDQLERRMRAERISKDISVPLMRSIEFPQEKISSGTATNASRVRARPYPDVNDNSHSWFSTKVNPQVKISLQLQERERPPTQTTTQRHHKANHQ